MELLTTRAGTTSLLFLANREPMAWGPHRSCLGGRSGGGWVTSPMLVTPVLSRLLKSSTFFPLVRARQFGGLLLFASSI